jgi:hypothetical protein
MTRSLTVAFANIGRGTPEQTRDAIALIAAQMLAFDTAALLLNEVDEADTADEHGLLSTAFRKWEDHAWDSREPILTKGVKVKRSSTRKAARGVTRQSPARPIHEVIVDGGDDPDIVLIGGHYPAGARNGQRAARTKAALVSEYVRMQAIHRTRIRHHRRAGRHIIWAMDANWRHFPKMHRAEGELINHGPDYIRVIPARGWEAVKAPSRKNNLPVEPLHKLLWAVVVFRPVKHPSN